MNDFFLKQKKRWKIHAQAQTSQFLLLVPPEETLQHLQELAESHFLKLYPEKKPISVVRIKDQHKSDLALDYFIYEVLADGDFVWLESHEKEENNNNELTEQKKKKKRKRTYVSVEEPKEEQIIEERVATRSLQREEANEKLTPMSNDLKKKKKERKQQQAITPDEKSTTETNRHDVSFSNLFKTPKSKPTPTPSLQADLNHHNKEKSNKHQQQPQQQQHHQPPQQRAMEIIQPPTSTPITPSISNHLNNISTPETTISLLPPKTPTLISEPHIPETPMNSIKSNNNHQNNYSTNENMTNEQNNHESTPMNHPAPPNNHSTSSASTSSIAKKLLSRPILSSSSDESSSDDENISRLKRNVHNNHNNNNSTPVNNTNPNFGSNASTSFSFQLPSHLTPMLNTTFPKVQF
jgi:hypothetical protein